MLLEHSYALLLVCEWMYVFEGVCMRASGCVRTCVCVFVFSLRAVVLFIPFSFQDSFRTSNHKIFALMKSKLTCQV